MNKQLETIFFNSIDLIGIGTIDGHFTRINPSFEKLFGYSEKEFMAESFIHFVASEDVTKTEAALKAAQTSLS